MTALTELREALHRGAFNTDDDYMAAIKAYDALADDIDGLVEAIQDASSDLKTWSKAYSNAMPSYAMAFASTAEHLDYMLGDYATDDYMTPGGPR